MAIPPLKLPLLLRLTPTARLLITPQNLPLLKKQKSVLDADALDSPFSFFKDLTSSDEDESSDVTVKSSTVILALKALAATLLSTIM
ncbi:hypothetical protein [Pontibacter sp. BAB1700]|uniref:hypothetical protein n=1 Tax=Pontibacter sp. BAB1700 TaxID=1144253 RepID=UPI00026BD22B|nr:hypothetical protein [Pontibacter sp. BAB1700]EJF09620.1 hypothetical protein O71_13951 [Pontibacter sp. BAB1700]